jgi:hypothetical protein
VLIREARAVLTSMLDDAGVNPTTAVAIDVRHAVEVFRRFAALPVEDAEAPEEDGDGVLAQFGTYGFRGQPEFSTDLTRQLVEVGGEDAPTWQLSCTLYWPPSRATDALASGQLWSFGKILDDFFDEAIILPGWAWALSGAQAPRDFVIVLGEV